MTVNFVGGIVLENFVVVFWKPDPLVSVVCACSYFLERTQSARGTLAKALQLCPDEVSISSFSKYS